MNLDELTHRRIANLNKQRHLVELDWDLAYAAGDLDGMETAMAKTREISAEIVRVLRGALSRSEG